MVSQFYHLHRLLRKLMGLRKDRKEVRENNLTHRGQESWRRESQDGKDPPQRLEEEYMVCLISAETRAGRMEDRCQKGLPRMRETSWLRSN